MNTLLIPCAGKSTRFPNMKPKFLLTYPDGKLMIEKALEGLNLSIFDRVIITITKKHDEIYNCKLILSQVFKNTKIEICTLDDFTKSESETVYESIKKMDIKGSLVIKDSDNYAKVNLSSKIKNSICGLDLTKNPNIENIAGKSFLLVNEQNLIGDIIEKRISSNIICIGIYCFEDVNVFTNTYLDLSKMNLSGELYISGIISYLLQKNEVFEFIPVSSYQDYGTLKQWKSIQKKFRTFFVDFDGVILKNSGKYGKINWDNNEEIIPQNLSFLKKMQDEGAQIVITTSRPKKYVPFIKKILQNDGILPYAIITGLYHSSRVLVNDFAPTNPYPSSISISIPRNSFISDYYD